MKTTDYIEKTKEHNKESETSDDHDTQSTKNN